VTVPAPVDGQQRAELTDLVPRLGMQMSRPNGLVRSDVSFVRPASGR
jgi:hypothetical protein